MVKIISKTYEDEFGRCPCCGWRAYKLYAFEGEDVDEVGMCANCFMDFLVENGADVTVNYHLLK